MWRTIIIAILLFGNLALGQDKVLSGEDDEPEELPARTTKTTKEDPVVQHDGSLDDQKIQRRSSAEEDEEISMTEQIPMDGVGKMGLLSTIKLVKDTANVAEDMAASGSLMNVFIQVAPDGTHSKELKKVIEEVEAHESDQDYTVGESESESPKPSTEKPVKKKEQKIQEESTFAPVDEEVEPNYSTGVQSSEDTDDYQKYIPIPIPVGQTTRLTPLQNHFQGVQIQALKQQQEHVEEVQKEALFSKEEDYTTSPKHVLELEADKNRAFQKQQRKQQKQQKQKVQQEYEQQEQIPQQQQQQQQEYLEEQAYAIGQQFGQEQEYPEAQQFPQEQQSYAGLQQLGEQQVYSDPQQLLQQQQSYTDSQQFVQQQNFATQSPSIFPSAPDPYRKQQNLEQHESVKLQALNDIATRQETLQRNSIQQLEGGEQMAESIQVQQPPQSTEHLFQHQAFIAQQALQDQVRQQQQLLHQQQLYKLQNMQQEAFQKQNQIWQNALEQQKKFYEQRTKQLQELQQKQHHQELLEKQKQEAAEQQALLQQQTLLQEQILHQETMSQQHEQHMQGLKDQMFFEGGQRPPLQQPFQQQSIQQQFLQQPFQRQPVQQPLPDLQPPIQQQGGFNQQPQQQPFQQQPQLPFQQPSQQPFQQQPFQQQPSQQPFQQQSFQQQALPQPFQQQPSQQPFPLQPSPQPFQQQPSAQPFQQQPSQQPFQEQQRQQPFQQPNQQPFQQQQRQQPFQQQQRQQSFQQQPNQQNQQNFQQQNQQNFQQQQNQQAFQQQRGQQPPRQGPTRQQQQPFRNQQPGRQQPPGNQQNLNPRPSPISNIESNELREHLFQDTQQLPSGFSPVRDTTQYTIYKVNENISPANAIKTLVSAPQNQLVPQNNVYTVHSPKFNVPPPAFNQNFGPPQQNYGGPPPPPLPPGKPGQITSSPLGLFQFHGPSSKPFLGPSDSPISLFGPSPTPFLGPSRPSLLETALAGSSEVPEIPPPLPPRVPSGPQPLINHHAPPPRVPSGPSGPPPLVNHHAPPPKRGFPRPIPLPRQKNEPVKYTYSPDVSLPPNELAFAAHQAKVLGGPAFRDDEPPGEDVLHAASSTTSKRQFSAQFKLSPEKTESELPKDLTPNSSTKSESHQLSQSQVPHDSSTKHHVRDPQLGELEVKEINVGRKSSIPKNVLANLLRVTTGDELIEYERK